MALCIPQVGQPIEVWFFDKQVPRAKPFVAAPGHTSFGGNEGYVVVVPRGAVALPRGVQTNGCWATEHAAWLIHVGVVPERAGPDAIARIAMPVPCANIPAHGICI